MAPAIVIAAILTMFFTGSLAGSGDQVFPYQETHGNRKDQISKDMLKYSHFILEFDMLSMQ